MPNLTIPGLPPRRLRARLVACCDRAYGHKIGFHTIVASALVLAGLLWSPSVRAQLDLGALQAQAPRSTFAHFKASGSDRVPLLVRAPSASTDEADAEGLFPLSPSLFGTYVKASNLSTVISRHPDWRFIWSPPRRPLLDKVVTNVHADVAKTTFGRTGANVIVGIVDTGVDLTHPDLQTADHKTRVRWYLDLAQSAPAGIHPDLEKTYGCAGQTSQDPAPAPCAIFDDQDINQLLLNPRVAAFPLDTIGHGTHVASLAAGNGLSNPTPKYIGIAPNAILVVVNASRQNQGDLQDPDIILGTKFVFDMADRLKLPAVVNLSLGGDAGAHDGTSTLERELSALVGPEFPGHAIVVAAGNSADLFNTTTQYPAPLGIHTSVQIVPDGNTTRVPIVVDKSAEPSIDSEFIAWVQTREGDALSVGVDTDSGDCIAPIPPGGIVNEKACAGSKVTLYNGVVDDPNGGSVERPAIAMVVSGKFEVPKVFAMTFKGAGTAFIWVQSQGALNQSLPTLGALVPAASRERTIAIPASATELIAVGATLNRDKWTDVATDVHQLKRFGSISNPLIGDIASFSAAGPNQLDDMKPDILAPGGYVVGAMATLADPRVAGQTGGMFDGTGICPDNLTLAPPACPDNSNGCLCYLIDDKHAIATGTSMASPLVAGAIALLFEANPKLTQDDVRRYIQSGAQKWTRDALTWAQEGPGVLDVNGALHALANDPTPSGAIDPYGSWLSVSTALVHPDNHWPTRAALHLRDGFGQPVTLDPARINIALSPGFLLSPVQAEGYGYYTFSFTAGDGAGRQTMDLEVQVDKRRIIKESLFIGVDVPSARGEVVAGRGCGIARRAADPASSFWVLLGTLGALCLQRRRHRSDIGRNSALT